MNVSGVLILVWRLYFEAAPQFKPWAQSGLQKKFLELFSSWYLVCNPCLALDSRTCSLGKAWELSLGQRKGTDRATHNVSLRLPQAPNSGAGYKKKETSMSQKAPISDPLSWQETKTANLLPFWHSWAMFLSALQPGREIRHSKVEHSPCKCWHEYLISLLWAFSPVSIQL